MEFVIVSVNCSVQRRWSKPRRRQAVRQLGYLPMAAKRDSLAVHLFTQDVAYQKLNYIHANPLAEHWQLVTDPCDYKYSSA